MANNRKAFLFALALILASTFLSISYAANYWVNQTVQVSAGGYWYCSGTLYSGNQLQGYFTSSGGDIKFYILDGSNFAKYQEGQSFIARYSQQAIQVPQVDFTVPYDGTWFILLDNTYSWWYSKAVTVQLSLNNGEPTTGPGGPTNYINILIWVTIGLAGLCTVGWLISKSQMKKVQNPLPQ